MLYTYWLSLVDYFIKLFYILSPKLELTVKLSLYTVYFLFKESYRKLFRSRLSFPDTCWLSYGYKFCFLFLVLFKFAVSDIEFGRDDEECLKSLNLLFPLLLRNSFVIASLMLRSFTNPPPSIERLLFQKIINTTSLHCVL